MPITEFPHRKGSIYDDAENLLNFILRIGMKLQILEGDSPELMEFKQKLLSWMNEELEKIGDRI